MSNCPLSDAQIDAILVDIISGYDPDDRYGNVDAREAYRAGWNDGFNVE